MKVENKDKKLKINLSNIPVESSLGLLALGDITFVEWRKVKKANNIGIGSVTKNNK